MVKAVPFLPPVLCTLALASSPLVALAQSHPPKSLLDSQTGSRPSVTPSSNQVTIARSRAAGAPGMVVTIQPGKEDYPGIDIKPVGAAWNLAAYGHVEAHVVNLGTKPLFLALRVDNAGDWKDSPTNTESATVAPGAAGTVKVIFGYTYGYKPGYALKPAAVVNMVLFTGKSDSAQSFRLESLVAAGPAGEKPPVAPDDIRIAPRNGILLGEGTPFPTAAQIVSQGVQAMPIHTDGKPALQVVFPVSAQAASVSVRPTVGRWDLRDFLAVHVTLHNVGKAPITPRTRIESNGGVSEWTTAAKPLLPGASTVLTIPFAPAAIPDLSKPETMGGITSDAVSAVTIAADRVDGPTTLQVEAVQAGLPTPQMPEWLGKRPPVAGNWIKTVDNDDPSQKRSDYASGYLHTYDRWAQRYGYFEARMKLPTAPGLWPAFWLMPDRGNRADPQWKRQSTSDGGMEFDIMEHLTRWGPHRYNIAMHWDGYDKDHKSLGSDKIYVQPDKDGFITTGLLWMPGSVKYYCNGREVLRWENPRISTIPSILMFTLPMGGWDNSPLEDARLPADFVIDYVRVWQRKDLAANRKQRPPHLLLATPAPHPR